VQLVEASPCWRERCTRPRGRGSVAGGRRRDCRGRLIAQNRGPSVYRELGADMDHRRAGRRLSLGRSDDRHLRRSRNGTALSHLPFTANGMARLRSYCRHRHCESVDDTQFVGPGPRRPEIASFDRHMTASRLTCLIAKANQARRGPRWVARGGVLQKIPSRRLFRRILIVGAFGLPVGRSASPKRR